MKKYAILSIAVMAMSPLAASAANPSFKSQHSYAKYRASHITVAQQASHLRGAANCGCAPRCGVEPQCGCAPQCGVEPQCGCEASSGCASHGGCGHCRPPLLPTLLNDIGNILNSLLPCHSCGSSCGCAAPACGCEAPACGCEAPSCGCDAPACDCDAPACGCEPSCGCDAAGHSGGAKMRLVDPFEDDDVPPPPLPAEASRIYNSPTPRTASYGKPAAVCEACQGHGPATPARVLNPVFTTPQVQQTLKKLQSKPELDTPAKSTVQRTSHASESLWNLPINPLR